MTPAIDSDKIVDMIIIISARIPTHRFQLPFGITDKQKGNPVDKQAANPAGLSKLPTILNILYEFKTPTYCINP